MADPEAQPDPTSGEVLGCLAFSSRRQDRAAVEGASVPYIANALNASEQRPRAVPQAPNDSPPCIAKSAAVAPVAAATQAWCEERLPEVTRTLTTGCSEVRTFSDRAGTHHSL